MNMMHIRRFLVYMALVVYMPAAVFAQQAAMCTNSYSRVETKRYVIPVGAQAPGANQLNSLKTDRAAAQADIGKTFYTIELTKFNDAAIGCANGPCENNVPGTAHRTWPLGSCVAICNVENKRCAVAKVMDRGPNTKLGCRTIDANPPLQQALQMGSGIVKATYRLVSLGTGNGRGNSCAQDANGPSILPPPGIDTTVQTTQGPQVFGPQNPNQSALDNVLRQNTGTGSFLPTRGASAQQPSQAGQLGQLAQNPMQQGSPLGVMPQGAPTTVPVYSSDIDAAPEDVVTCSTTTSKTTIRWSCPEGTRARGIASPSDSTFFVRDVRSGIDSVFPERTTTYTIRCVQNQVVVTSGTCRVRMR